jgi:Big-like domain-containing protein
VNQATPITFSAIVSAPSGITSLTGKVAFTDNTTTIAICSAVAPSPDGTSGSNSLWLAQCSGSTLTAGSHTIAASYTGDTNFGNTSASGITVTLAPAATSIAVTAAPNPSSFNQSVTFTAAVSAPAGGVSLSSAGSVAFTDSVTSAAIKDCSSVKPTANGVATCSYSGLAIGSHTITVAYSGDPNFTSSSNTVVQSVGATATTTSLIANPPSATFNTSVTFTATVASAAQGGTAFSGTMAFTDNGATIPGCGAVAVNGTSGIATCVTSTLPAGADTIIAAYSNDKNFGGSTASLTEQVTAASATITLAPTTPAPILAVNPNGMNDAVTFTASIFPPYSGTVPLSGTMIFTDTITANGTTSSAPICKVAPSASGVAVCACPSASCALPSGQNTITASYTGDPNLTPAPSAAVSQLVEDYSLVVSSAPPVAVTQGFTTSNDLFSSQTISISPTSISGFTTASGAPLALTCAVTAVAPATGATAPLCTLGGSTLAVAASGTPEPTVSIVLDATKATAGTYSVTLNTADPTTGLAHSSSAFNVVVRGVDGPLTLVSGATTGNTASVSFLLPAGVSLSNIACSFAAGPNLSSMVAPSSLSIGCSFSPTTIPASGSQQNGSTTIAITTGSTTSSLDGHGSLLFAGVIGIPLFGLFGLLRGRRSLGAALLRLLAIAMIGAAAFQAMGCGGSFQRSTATGGGQTPPGAYDLLITGKGSDGNTYQAVLSLNVTL